ncbi:MAG TPA: hypothetical protein VND45_00300 [Thermoanaerobaculia bacterium]|nr:hypothetical protein [Thermoanaerobaculia bacterium]
MALPPFAAETLALEARALLTRAARLQPFALVMPMVGAARVSDAAALAVEHYLIHHQRQLRRRIRDYLRWLRTPGGRAASPVEAQRRFAFLKLRFNAAITQFDIFADALSVRGEVGNGVWLGGLDVAAEDALQLEARVFEMPPVITYLDRGHGAAIRRARTRLPGGGENPAAVIRIPRERMVGSGIASSLVHEVGHQGAALLDLVPSLRRELRARQRWSRGLESAAWQMWDRWISEIIADFWAMAKLGIAATQGLLNVVSLPRAFVFRIAPDDPHPFPWIRAKLSIASGAFLYPDPQWTLVDRLWESFYPPTGLDPQRQALIESLEATMLPLVRLIAGHRTRLLGAQPLIRAFDVAGRRPQQLRRIFRDTRGSIPALQSLAPTLAFAVLGQAKQDRQLTPENESRIVAELLTRWGLRRAIGDARTAHSQPKAAAA